MLIHGRRVAEKARGKCDKLKKNCRFISGSCCVTDMIPVFSVMIYHGYGLCQDKLLTRTSKSQTSIIQVCIAGKHKI